MYPQRVRAEEPLETHETLHSSQRRLSFGLNSHSPGVDFVALWGRNPALAQSEAGNRPPQCGLSFGMHYTLCYNFSIPSLGLCHADILCKVTRLSKEKGFPHQRCGENGQIELLENLLAAMSSPHPKCPPYYCKKISKSLLPVKAPLGLQYRWSQSKSSVSPVRETMKQCSFLNYF